MMLRRHITRGLHATAAIALLWVCGGAFAGDAQLPGSDGVSSAYSTLRQWTDAFELPKPSDTTSHVSIEGATGVCVIVRRSGRLLGMGADCTGDDLMLRRATAHALSAVLADATVSALPENVRNSIGPSLTVEIEVAGKRTPLVGRDIAQLASRIEPGLDGVALQRGQSLFGLFPSQMRATNTAGDSVSRLISLAVQAGLDAADLENLARLPDVTVYSFRTVHLIQPGPGRPPIQTFRGDLVVPMSSIDQRAMVDLADGIAAHLISGMFPDPASAPSDQSTTPPERNPVGLMGAYRPFADQYEPLIAPPLEQALGALALLKYSQCPAIDRASAAAASECASQILRDLVDVTQVELPPCEDPAAAAAIIHAITPQPSLRTDAVIARLLDDAVRAVVSSFDANAGFVAPQVDSSAPRPISPHGQALIASAMCRLLTMKNDRPAGAAGMDESTVRSALDRAWQSVPAHQRIALLPWIGWAEADFARATGAPLSHSEDLRLMKEALDRSRIRFDSGAPPDLIGGLSLTASTTLVDRPAADAQTIRPAAWLASVIRDERLTLHENVQAAIQDHLQTMRFIVQLTTREAVLATCRNPERARGGVRAAPWDMTQPVPAQALALITAIHAIQVMADAADARNRP